MADRYTYVAAAGWFLAVVAVGTSLGDRGRGWRRTLTVLFVVYAVLLGALTRQRCQVWQDSLSLWNDVLGRSPGVWIAWDNRGSARAELGDFAGAIADHTRAIELQPAAPSPYFNRGNARFRSGDFPGAVADYNAAILLDPDSVDAHRNRALALRFAAASTSRDEDTGGEPAAPATPLDEAALARAVASFDAGDYGGAIEQLDALVEGEQGYPTVLLARGLAHYHRGNIPAALSDLDAAVALDPDLAPAWAYRAAIRLVLGDARSALADCSRAVELDPQLVDAWITRGAAHHNLGHSDQALADLDRAVALDPSNPKAHFNRAMVRLLTGDRDRGCRELREALALGSAEAEAALARHCRTPPR
jgi:tetratricopeptide (TPR) repeat protein